MEKSFYIDERELEIICEALEEKLEVLEQIPEEKVYVGEIRELLADLKEELQQYNNLVRI